MKNTIKVAIFMMAIMFSASMAFGQNDQDPGNNNIGDPYTYLYLTVQVPETTLTMDVKAIITWYNDGEVVKSAETKTGTYIGNNTWTFTPPFDCPTYLLQPGDPHVEYLIKAYNLNNKVVNAACGTYEIIPGCDNFLTITPSMWNGINGCVGTTEFGSGEVNNPNNPD
jgi:hypothetical protein